MTRNKFIAMVSAAAVSATAATAGLALADGRDRDDQAKVQMFLTAPYDLTAAINAAVESSSGSAVKASYDEDNGTGVYEVDVVSGGQTSEVTVDATSGQVVETRSESSDRDDAVDLTRLGGDLASIVAMAESQTGDKVIAIDAEHHKGSFVGMEIETANADGTTREYLLGIDGKLTPIMDRNHKDQGRDRKS